MGLFDKMKHMAGGHGVTVTFTEIEGEAPASATLPALDSILKGRIQVSGESEVVILKHVFRLTAILEADDTYREVVVAESVNEGEIIGAPYTWPYTLSPGETVDDGFLLGPFDLSAAMAGLDLAPEDATDNENVRLELRAIADVKGTPMDASAKQVVPVVPGGAPEPVDTGDGLPDIPVRTESLPLDDRPYLERFRQMIDELEADPRIEVTQVEIHDPAPETLIDRLAKKHPVPDAMRRFYTQANGLTLRWKMESDDEPLEGDIELLPIEKVYGSWEDVLWFEWSEDLEKEIHALDYFVPEACCGIRLDGSDDPRIYFMDDEPQPLEVDFAGYLELLLASRGFWYWPTALVADMTGEEYTTSPGHFRRSMPKLFADYDPDFFLRRGYEDEDQAADDARAAEIEALRAVLDAQGASYTLKDGGTGYVNVSIADTKENLAKVSAAMDGLGMSGDFSGDWGAMSIGTFMFEKEAG